jgi:hypothetical protein
MATDATTRFPIEIDFTDYLCDNGAYVPGALIVIKSTCWDDGGKHEGKPEMELPEQVEYWLGDNMTFDKDMFVRMLNNYCFEPRAGWYYNRINWAIQDRMTKPIHLATRGLSK